MAMKDYLSVATAGYNYTVSIVIQEQMDAMGVKKQVIHELDDGSVAVAALSNRVYFNLTVQFDALTETDAWTILDLWLSSSKCNGSEKTFYLYNPKDTYTYVVRFMEPLTKRDNWKLGALTSIVGFKLRVEGYKSA